MIEGKLTTVGLIPGVPRWRSTVNKLFKRAYLAAVQFWWRALRPKHFRLSAKSEYHYTPRKKRYLIRKARQKHHGRPLVFSGELERMSKIARFTGTRHGARAVLPKANKANLRHPNSEVNMREELTRISRGDKIQMAKTAARHLHRQWKALKTKHTKRTK